VTTPTKTTTTDNDPHEAPRMELSKTRSALSKIRFVLSKIRFGIRLSKVESKIEAK